MIKALIGKAPIKLIGKITAHQYLQIGQFERYFLHSVGPKKIQKMGVLKSWQVTNKQVL